MAVALLEVVHRRHPRPAVAATSAPSVVITNNNATEVAATAGSADSVASSATGGLAPLSVTQPTQAGLTLRTLAKQVLHLGSGQALQPQATANCQFGGTVTAPDDPNATSGTVSFNQCNDGSVILNGSATIALLSGDPNTDNYSATITFNNFQVTIASDTTTVNASMKITSSSNGTNLTSAVTISYFDVTHNADYVTLYNFNITEVDNISTNDYTLTLDYTFESNLINGAVHVVTDTPITGNYNNPYDYPYTGVLVITGANKAQVRVSTNGNGQPTDLVTVEVDADGDGVYETSTTMTWAEYDMTSVI